MFIHDLSLLPELISKISSVLPSDKKIFIVGGAVRDLLLGRPVHDLDLVMQGEVMEYARRLANALNAAFYPMDPEHGVARLILRSTEGGKSIVDIASMRGPDLAFDLSSRDFTINAIALDIQRLHELIDPLGGAKDLQEKMLVQCKSSSFLDDPVRILRGFRLASAYKLRISEESRKGMKQAVPSLHSVSPERLRDEIFRILDGPQPTAALQGLDIIGALTYILPELAQLKGVEQSLPHQEDVWNHTLSVVRRLESIFSILGMPFIEEKSSNLNAGLLVMRLGRYRHQIGQHLEERLNPDRSIKALILLAALYHDIAKPETRMVEPDGRIRFLNHENLGGEIIRARGQALHLSNDEVNRLVSIVKFHMRPLNLAIPQGTPSPRAVYRFFKDTGNSGIDICIHALADYWAAHQTALVQVEWDNLLQVVQILMKGWWEKPEEQVNPPSLISGNDIISHFQLQPGPLIGELIEEVREAQVLKLVVTKDDALEIIKKKLDQSKSII